MIYKKGVLKDYLLKIKRIYKSRGLYEIIKIIIYKYAFWGQGAKYRKLCRLYRLRLYNEVLNLGKKIINYNLENAYFYKKLAVSYWYNGDTASARENLYLSLELRLKPDSSISDIIKIIQKSIDPNIGLIKSEYNYLGGEVNLGFIEHIYHSDNGVKHYLTKILNTDEGKKERIFYSNIRNDYELLKEYTPEVISIIEIKELIFITLEKINGENPKVHDICKIIDMINKIESLGVYKSADIITNECNNIKLNYKHGFPFNGNGFYLIFAKIHEKSSNQQVFRWLKKRMRFLKCSSEVYKLAARLEAVILKKKTYEKIVPSENYYLLHNDLNSTNIIIDDTNQKYYIIDWERVGIGPKGYDLILIFRRYSIKFKQIRELYLDYFDDNSVTIINKIFFIYPLIISYFTWPTESNMSDLIDDFLKPAVEYIEYLAEKL